jgi:hypothetical protein
MKRLSLLLALMILCSGAGGVEVPRDPNEYPTDNPMRIVVVRSSRPGCEPKCAEWISAEVVDWGIVDRLHCSRQPLG